MDYEDSRLALFPEPNAFVQNYDKVDKNKEIKKIVFQEPYETLPNFYINNNFTKNNCDCAKRPNSHDCNQCKNYSNYCDNNNNHHKNLFSNKDSFDKYNHDSNFKNFNSSNHLKKDENVHQDNSQKQNGFGFDLKSLLPLLGAFNKGGADLSQLIGLLNNSSNSQNGNGFNPMNLISNVLSNKGTMGGLLNLFKGGDINKKEAVKKEINSTDFEIKNYTRVE